MFNYDSNDDNISINNECMIHNTDVSSKLSEIDCSIVSLCLSHSNQISTSFCSLNKTSPSGNFNNPPKILRLNIDDRFECESYIKVIDKTFKLTHQNLESNFEQYENVLSPNGYFKENNLQNVFDTKEDKCFNNSKFNFNSFLENPVDAQVIQTD